MVRLLKRRGQYLSEKKGWKTCRASKEGREKINVRRAEKGCDLAGLTLPFLNWHGSLADIGKFVGVRSLNTQVPYPCMIPGQDLPPRPMSSCFALSIYPFNDLMMITRAVCQLQRMFFKLSVPAVATQAGHELFSLESMDVEGIGYWAPANQHRENCAACSLV